MDNFTNTYTFRRDGRDIYNTVYGYYANIDDTGDLVICIQKGLITKQKTIRGGTWTDLTVKQI